MADDRNLHGNAGLKGVPPHSHAAHRSLHDLSRHGRASQAAHDHSAGHDHLPPLNRLWLILRPDLTDIGVVAIFSVVVGLLQLATPVAVEALVNTVSFGALLQPLIVMAGVLFVFLGFAALLKGLQTYIAEIIQRRLFVRVVADLSQRLPRVRREAFDGANGAELLNRFFDVMTVQKSAALLVLDGIAIVMQTAIGMFVLGWYHSFLIGFDLVLLVSMLFIVFVLGHGAVASAIRESLSKYAVASWLEQIALFPVSFRLDGGATALRHADNLTREYVLARKSHFSILLRQLVFSLLLQIAAGSVMLGLGGWLVVQGDMTLGQLVAAELIVSVIVGSLAKLGKHLESFYDMLSAVDKLGHLFDLPGERLEGEPAPDSTRPPQLAAINLGYRFAGQDGAFGPFTARFAPGERVAITGPDGAGKSVLLELLFGMRDPTSGHVEYDGVDLRRVELNSYREQTLLLSGVEVFAGTIAENLRPADGATTSALRDALEKVSLWDEVMTLPHGLDTLILQHGPPLSGSQAKRLVLARAFCRPVRLLLIDDLLDSLSDDQIEDALRALDTLRLKTTIIIVTGRRRVMEACDRVITLTKSTAQEPYAT